MRLTLFPLLFSLFALLWLPVSIYALEGQVLDADGNAIGGALVEVSGKRATTVTDEYGYFKFGVGADSALQLHVSANGYVHKTVEVDATQLSQRQKVVLTRSVIFTESIDVIGVPMHVSSVESSMPSNVLSGDELLNKQAATLGDTLSDEVGVHTSFHGNVASTPIVRGLSGPRVLITQNSLDASDVSRIGPDHSVASEVSTAERVEVLRGPATLFFGSGAIGGVVNVVDNRVPQDNETTGSWSLSHDSVNDQDLASFSLQSGAGDVAVYLDGFTRESNDYEVPVAPDSDEDDGSRSVANSGEDSEGFTVGSSYLLDNGFVGFSYGRLERDYGIPGHGHGEEEHEEGEEGEEEEEHEEEQVNLGLKQDRFQVMSELFFDHRYISAINTRLGYTDYTHTEFENGASGTTFENETYEAKIELLHQLIAGWEGGIVLDYKSSDFAAIGDEAFAPPSETDTFALALLEERHFGDVLLQFGARVEQVSIKSNAVSIADVEFHEHGHDEEAEGEAHSEDEHGGEAFSFDEDYTPFSLSMGAIWDFTPGYNIGISVSHSQRAPSAAELLSYGPHIATGTFEVGALFEAHEEDGEIGFEALSTKPEMEKSNNIDVTFRKFEGDVGFIFNAFYNQVENYYAQFDTELFAEAGHGDEEGEEHAHAGELPVFLFQSADATFRGAEAQAVWQMAPRFKSTVFADYVRAKLDQGGNLPRIPPLRFGASLDYVYQLLSANISWTSYMDQEDVAELETETKGYNWVDLGVNYRIPVDMTELTLFFKAENIGDQEARVHSSFLKDLAPRPGRNYRVGIRGRF